MEIQYVIINFIILVVILVLFGRKMIKSIFSKRMEQVQSDLAEIEKAQNTQEAAFDDFIPEITEDIDRSEVESAKKTIDERVKQINAFKNRECHEIHREMVTKARKSLFAEVKSEIKELFLQAPYKDVLRSREEAIIDEILTKVKLTPGDMAYLKHHNVLYVTLTSAYKLDERIVKKVDDFTSQMLAEVNGKTSLWVLEDSELIGGLKLRIGDTIYDGTVLEELYRFEKNINNDPILNDDAEAEILKEFTETVGAMTPEIHEYQLGRVMTVSDGICWMDGLADIMYGEVVEFECGESGMVLDIQPNRIGCVIFGEYDHIESGSKVRRVGRIASVPVGEKLLGRVVNAVGKAIDGKGYIITDEKRQIEFKAPGILERSAVNEPLHTGIKAIDALVPIGKGQRELIIGDRQTGKTAIAVDTIINQKGKNTICIYVAIGQKETTIADIREKLIRNGALDYTIIVAANASESAALQYIAPFSGTAMGEHFMYSGKDVLIIYDDLSKHAVAYRELSLLLHRPSGREAYPGDIFYLHSRLLERSAHLSEKLGGGSLTALPIIETLAGDISAYIPTNVISITDGQIFLDSELFNEGQRPAINVGLSVSRVGSAAQTKLMKQVSANLRTKLAQYRELSDFMQFSMEIDDSTKKTLDLGSRLMAVLRQRRYKPIDDHLQALLLFAVQEGFADDVKVEDIDEFEVNMYMYFNKHYSDLLKTLSSGEKLTDETKQILRYALNAYLSHFKRM